MLEVTCPRCSTPIPYVDELVGREVFCLGCGRHFLISRLEAKSTDASSQPLSPVSLEIQFPLEAAKRNDSVSSDLSRPEDANG